MDIRFYALIFIAIQLVFIYFNYVITYSFFNLYRRKKNPEWPLFWEEAPGYVEKGETYKVILSPFYYLNIIYFERHKDKELRAAANKTRLLDFAYLVYLILGFVFLGFVLRT